MAPQRVVFDLDGVIASRDTMAELIRRQLVAHPGRVVAGILPVAGWTMLKRWPTTRALMSRTLGMIALSGMTASDYRALAVSIGAELAAHPGWVIPEGVAALRRHLDAGDDVTVTTGTEEHLSRAFLDAVGVPGAHLVATQLSFARRARYDNHNLGPRKVGNLDGRTIDLFYTDSEMDLDVAKLASRTVLVNPSPRVERVFRLAVRDLEVTRWSSSAEGAYRDHP